MNEINFLPETFVRHRAAQKRRYSHVVVAAAVVGLLALWWMTEKSRLSSLRGLEHELERRVAEAQGQLTEVIKLQGEKKVLVNQDRIRRELAQSISHTAVVEMLGQAMPTSIAITDMTMVARHPPLRTVADTKAAKSSKTTVKAPASEETLLIEFTGLAPNDVEIANLVGALSDHPIFTNVKMIYSRSVTRRNVIGREFRVEMQVPLDCDYRPHKTESRTQEVADAG